MMPKVTFATSCFEGDWKEVLLAPEYLAERQIGRHAFPFSEKLLVINNVARLGSVMDAARKRLAEGVLTRIAVADETADEAFRLFQLRREDFVSPAGLSPDWVYYNALAPLSAIYLAEGEYLLYQTGDVHLEYSVAWIPAAIGMMGRDSRNKVANLLWNGRHGEAAREAMFCERGFYVSARGFSDQMFLVEKQVFQAPLYSEIREDSHHFPRGDVFEKRVFSAMRNRGWRRLTFAKGSYTHESF